MLAAACWAKTTRGSSFDFSQTVCCRGHVCVTECQKHYMKQCGFFSGRRQPLLLSLAGRSDRVTWCAAAWQFLSSSEDMTRGSIQGSVTALGLDNWCFVSNFTQGFHLFSLHLWILKPISISSSKDLSQWSFPEIKPGQNFRNGVEWWKNETSAAFLLGMSQSSQCSLNSYFLYAKVQKKISKI